MRRAAKVDANQTEIRGADMNSQSKTEIKTDGVTPWCRWYTTHQGTNVYCVISKIDDGYRLSWVNGVWHGQQHKVRTWDAVEHACRAYPTICALANKPKHTGSYVAESGKDEVVIEAFAPAVVVYSFAYGKRAAWAGYVQSFANLDDLRAFNRQMLEGTIAPPVIHAEQLKFVQRLVGM